MEKQEHYFYSNEVLMDTVVNPSGNFLDGGLLINLRKLDSPSMLIDLFVVAWF
jgi:hypothetical protein